MKQKLVEKKYLATFIIVTTLFALWGFANDITNPMVAAFQTVMELSAAKASMIQFAFYGGYATMAIPAALFIRRYSYKSGILLGLGLYATGAFLFMGLTLDDALDVVELVECLEGSEVVDVEVEYLIAHLGQHGVVELEEVELSPLMPVRHLYAASHLAVLAGLKLVEHTVSTLDNGTGHTREFGHVDTKTMFAAATL